MITSVSMGVGPGEEYFLKATTLETTVLAKSVRWTYEKCLDAYKSLHKLKTEFLSFTSIKLTLVECGLYVLEGTVLEEAKGPKT